jgi:hypothetical protein
MSSTVFTGPLLAGNVLNSDGTGNLAGVGGSSGQQNVGFCLMTQASAITQSNTAAVTQIVVPAQSQIVDIRVAVTTAWGSSNTISVGTSSSSNELVTGLSGAQGLNIASTNPSSGTIGSLISAWNNVSNTQDVAIYVKSSSTGTGGVGVLIVSYLQAINGFTNEQYT